MFQLSCLKILINPSNNEASHLYLLVLNALREFHITFLYLRTLTTLRDVSPGRGAVRWCRVVCLIQLLRFIFGQTKER